MSYQNPKENSKFKRILKKNDVNKCENKLGFVQPEVIIRRLND